ncbi:hypothetical protein E2C01_047078 [Portunus trituberculatus]|uniref:Uncharacterized protein n=1 Tax=Portunus trituberculatus TaxID=210409 RepID=A0A5B7G074_PORTR|nr:hypothetical protein [Portunus trituberculatus]
MTLFAPAQPQLSSHLHQEQFPILPLYSLTRALLSLPPSITLFPTSNLPYSSPGVIKEAIILSHCVPPPPSHGNGHLYKYLDNRLFPHRACIWPPFSYLYSCGFPLPRYTVPLYRV